MAETIRRIIAENASLIDAEEFAINPNHSQTVWGDLLGVPVAVELASYLTADERVRIRARLIYEKDWHYYQTIKSKKRQADEFVTPDDLVLHEQGFKLKDFVNLLGSKTS